MKDILIYLFLSLLFLFLMFFYKEIYFVIPLLFSLYRIFIIDKKLIIVSLFLMFLLMMNYHLRTNIPKVNNTQFKVVKVNKYNYFVENESAKVLLKTDLKFVVGDEINIQGKIKRVESINNFNLFNYENYLQTHGIYHEVFSNEIQIIKKGDQLKKATTKLSNYFNYLFLMDKTEIDENIVNSLVELSILHLVVVSGFHFNILFNLSNKLCFFIKNNQLRNIIIFGILFWYLKILLFAYPAFRSFLNLFIRELDIDELSSLNRYGLIGIILLFIFPSAPISFSFILTMYTSFWIIVLPKFIKENKIVFSFYLMLLNIPLIASINAQISLLSFAYTIIFTPIILLLYAIVFISYLIVPLKEFGTISIELFEKLITLTNKHNLVLETGYLPILFCFMFIVLVKWLLTRKKPKYYYLMLPLVLVVVYTKIPPVFGSVTFLNVGQGDCIIIRPPLSFKVMMIDVAKPFKQNTVNSIIIPYLKAERIKEVEKLVITHDDIDHSGGEEDLRNNFKVKEVIRDKQKIINFDQYQFLDLLAKSKFKDKNSNSLTLYSRINGLNYFFAGDLSQEGERELNRYVKKLPVDVLKIAHHGSKTSTSQTFLNLTKPKFGIVSAKKTNSYQHPHQEIVTRLEKNNVKIFKTGFQGTIRINFVFFFNYFEIYQR